MIKLADYLRLTIRARAALALHVACQMLPALKPSSRLGMIAAKSISTASTWPAALAVNGDQLSNLILDNKDRGLAIEMDRLNPKSTDDVLLVVQEAIAYVAWHAYRREQHPMPESYEAITEELFLDIVGQAKNVASFDFSLMLNELGTLLQSHLAADADELGGSVVLSQVISGPNTLE